MKFIGAHVSASGGVENAPVNAHAIGAKSFAFFTKRRGSALNYVLMEKNMLRTDAEL